MAKGFLGGMTDYSHQSFMDIVHDLQAEEKNVAEFVKKIKANLAIVSDNGYWDSKVIPDFRIQVAYSLKHYETAQQELQEIYNEIQIEVKQHHITRLLKLSEVADKINGDIGKIWHQDYEEAGLKNYGNENFQIVEDIYSDTRDAAVNLLDMSNIARRFGDYVGRTRMEMPKQKETARLQLSHKIALYGLGVALIVLLFGNNLVGRFFSNNPGPNPKDKTKISDSSGSEKPKDTSTEKEKAIDKKMASECSTNAKFQRSKNGEHATLAFHGISIKFYRTIGTRSPFPPTSPYYISEPLRNSILVDYCSRNQCSSPVPNNIDRNERINAICIDDANGIAAMLCMQIPTNDLLVNADASAVIKMDYQHPEIYTSGDQLSSLVLVNSDDSASLGFTTAFDTTRRFYRATGLKPDYKCAKGWFRLIKLIN